MTATLEAIDELRHSLHDHLDTSEAVRAQHGTDESPLEDLLPDAVAFPENDDEVAACLQVCNRHSIPVIPFGAGTSLEGHVLASSGGLAMDLARMNGIVSVAVDDLDATVQAGVTRKQLQDHLRHEGLFFPVDPGADATLGGMAATGASGTTTVRYGAMRENVLGLKVVLADGRIIKTAHRARKTSAGLDLTRLFIGSEGTLGVITELTLRVYGIPEATGGALCHFPSTEAAVGAVIATLQLGIPIARVEFLDEPSMEAINAFSNLSYPVAPTLLFEFHGTAASVTDETKQVGSVVEESGGLAYRSTTDTTERMRLWQARHNHFFAARALRPGARAITTDVCVPISSLAGCMVEARRDIDESGLTATIVGHVGDGNFHIVLLVNPEDPDEVRAADELNASVVERALSVGGTCTGEHGIGLRKRESLRAELGEAVDVMRAVKRALDPAGIMNPGKVFHP